MQPYDSLEKDQHQIASFAEKKSSMNMEWCSLYGASMVPMVGMLRINKWFNRDKNETRLFLGWQPKEKKNKKRQSTKPDQNFTITCKQYFVTFYSFPFFRALLQTNTVKQLPGSVLKKTDS